MEPVVTVASAHQWDGEKNQREAPGGLVSLAAVLPKLTGLKVRWLKLPARRFHTQLDKGPETH